MNWKDQVLAQVEKTRQAAAVVANLATGLKNDFLGILADRLRSRVEEICRVNQRDLRRAERKGCPPAFLDRLALNPERVEKLAKSVENVRGLPDPVGKIIWESVRPNGLVIKRIRVPIGVIGIIYESRPDVTVETSILCLKAGNCVVLRGGKEATHSNQALASVIQESLQESRISPEAVCPVTAGGRQAVKFLLSLNRHLDLVIPRGGQSLIEAVVKNSRIPVIKHYKGVCHTYVDKEAKVDMAVRVTYNAKVQRPGTCNATETLLVHKEIAREFLPRIAELFQKAGVEMRGCPRTREILPFVKSAVAEDWGKEYLDLIIAIKMVDDLADAIDHINTYGTRHSDAIITENRAAAEEFFRRVDSAALYHNASTRFTDGGQFGLGAEIGISTDKIHARGPMGLEELTTYKYLIYGQGQLRT